MAENARPLPIQAAPSEGYGERVAQERAQRAVPMAPPPTAPPAPAQAPAPRPTFDLVPLDAPTQRPDEPLTTGIATGPGAGPEALGVLPGGAQDIEEELVALYRHYPNDDLRELLEGHQAGWA